ncbi:MAG: hypothetical protein ACRD2E_02090 [Terriglobales bacterium]
MVRPPADTLPRTRHFLLFAALATAALAAAPLALPAAAPSSAGPIRLDPAAMARLGRVSPRFQSFNIEMVEVTGGHYWKPYPRHPTASRRPQSSNLAALFAQAVMQIAPINLANPRLRRLATALGPRYLRVSGTSANSVYFFDGNGPAPKQPPAGFTTVLTRAEWRGVIRYARATGARIVTSFAISPGTRDARGVWTAAQARRWLAFTRAAGGRIAAAEFMNEPNIAGFGGAPKGYDAADFGSDVRIFRRFLHSDAPHMLLVGPGTTGEGPYAMAGGPVQMLTTAALMRATGPVFPVFSYHLYAALSQRCAAIGPSMQVTAAQALSPQWFSRPENINAFYAGIRSRFEPGKPLWITETADAACGGNPWAARYLDTFRYLIQHGSLARHGVQVIMHNTLVGSTYGLLAEGTFRPRPDYWAALLWSRLMGATVLDPRAASAPNTYIYAQCLRGHSGGVALLALNAGRQAATLRLPLAAERYTLTAPSLESRYVALNRQTLRLGPDNAMPDLGGKPVRAGNVSLPPLSSNFFALSAAHNPACR